MLKSPKSHVSDEKGGLLTYFPTFVPELKYDKILKSHMSEGRGELLTPPSVLFITDAAFAPNEIILDSSRHFEIIKSFDNPRLLEDLTFCIRC